MTRVRTPSVLIGQRVSPRFQKCSVHSLVWKSFEFNRFRSESGKGETVLGTLLIRGRIYSTVHMKDI